MESLVTPLQDKIEDWKKTANQLDKDHAKGTRTHVTHAQTNSKTIFATKSTNKGIDV